MLDIRILSYSASCRSKLTKWWPTARLLQSCIGSRPILALILTPLFLCQSLSYVESLHKFSTMRESRFSIFRIPSEMRTRFMPV
jgi:hypothetical protein